MSALNDALYPLFANPRHPTVQDIIAVGGVLDWKILKHAYENGIFPWPHENYPMLWFSPEERGVLDFQDLKIPRTFRKWMKKNESALILKEDTCFAEVVRECRRQKRNGQKGTWINDEIEKAYCDLHARGGAFSFEVFREKKLVGGIYGVRSKNYRSCESMFHLEDNMSKVALLKLVEKCGSVGEKWLDTQMVTPVCESFGAKLIPKEQFLGRILV